MTSPARLLPGLLLVAGISLIAHQLARLDLLRNAGFGALTLAIALGAALGNLVPRVAHGRFRDGLDFSQRRLLRAGVALFGLNLSVQQIVQVGRTGVLIDVLMVTSTLALGWLVGVRLLRMERDTVILTAAGSAICGAAAVVATVPMLAMDERAVAEKSAVAVATVVLFGTLSMLLYPLLYHLVGPRFVDFGIYVGSTVHEVGQVVAIGGALGGTVADNAVIVKMIRVLLLVPFLLAVGTWRARKTADGTPRKLAVPWFALGFVALAGLNSLQLAPETWIATGRLAGTLLLTAAMAALGVGTNLARIGRAGLRPLLLGAGLFAHLVLSGMVLNHVLA